LVFGVSHCALAHAQVSSDWFRQPAISPDGTQIVFASGGDLYLVPAAGGRATPLTISESYESSPVWSHDGTMIAFASDRAGNDDVYVMPATGGPPTRLTFHSADDAPSDFTFDNSAVIFTSARMDDVKSALFPSGVLAELYSVPVSGGTPTMVLTTPALSARFDGGGQRLLYEDRKGYEDELRKHHQSSIARDLWMVDLPTGNHMKLTEFPGEDREPQWSADGRTVFFLSERNGDFNVFKMPLGDESKAEQLTRFEKHPVRSLSRAADGTMAFSWHGDLYTLTEGQEPKKLDITIGVDGRAGIPATKTERSGATEFVASPNGKEVAFVLRGEVFVTSVEYATTRRITDTPEQERSVSFAPDGRSLVYAGERDGSWNIYKASLVDDDELYFFSSTKIEEKPLVATDGDEFQPTYSPDGKKVAYLFDRSEIRVVDVESGATNTAVPGSMFYSYSDGDLVYGWSPDSVWIATQLYTRGRIFSSEIGMKKADGTGDVIELSQSGFDDNSPAFTRDGGAVLWASNRYGQRAQGGDGSQYDVVGVFLNQEAYDKFQLSKEDFELRKELKEKKEKKDKKDKEKEEAKEGEGEAAGAEPAADADKDSQEKADGEDDEKKVEPITIEIEGLDTRRVRFTINASDLGEFAMSPDGDKLYYLAKFEKGFDLWVHDFREESTKILAKLGADGASMELSEDGDTLFLLADGSLSKIDTKSGDKKGISFQATMIVDGGAERQNMFDHMWRQTRAKFYRKDMHGVDWDFYRAAYEPKLAGIANNRDFAILLSEILGELNASHTGGRYRPQGSRGPATASLGAFYENNAGAGGLKIAEVIKNGPLDKAELGIVAGDIIVAINGSTIDGATDWFELLTGKAGERVRLTIRPAAGGDEREVVVKPVSQGEEGELLYQRWVRSRDAIVQEASGGRLGYAHVRGMNDASFRAFYQEAMGKHFDKEALIVDTRFNGGGWLHDDLATFLTGKAYVDLYPRNDLAPDVHYFGDPANRWTKPSIVVMSESNYSDAHFFPWVYTELKIGDTVGMPVPGTATAVWWERLYTGDIIFGIPQVGTKGVEGKYLENEQLEPTHRMPLDPESAAAGKDTQLLEAVRVMLDQLDHK